MQTMRAFRSNDCYFGVQRVAKEPKLQQDQGSLKMAANLPHVSHVVLDVIGLRLERLGRCELCRYMGQCR